MLALLVAAAYSFPANQIVNYDLNVTFDGYVPVMGGLDGTVVAVKLKMMVKGLEPKEHPVRLEADLTDAVITIDGEKLPFTVDSLKSFFPKNTISATPFGEIKENDAPDLKLPVQLPGLHIKRIPEISYMPIQFPADMQDGKAFTYKKPFGESVMEYEVTPRTEGSTIHFAVKLKQTYTYLEDETNNKVDIETDAKFKVSTIVAGGGAVAFDTTRGQVLSSKIVVDGTDTVTEIKTGAKKDRKLKTTLECKRTTP